MPTNACISFLSVGRVTQLFGLSLVTAVSSVLTPALNARLLSFHKIVIPLIKSPVENLPQNTQHDESGAKGEDL